MSDYVYPVLVAVAVLGTLVVRVYYFVRAASIGATGSVLAKIGGSFALYMLVFVVSFLFAVGLCAAGCPRELNFLLTLFYYGLSLFSVFSLRNFYRRLINDSTPSNTS